MEKAWEGNKRVLSSHPTVVTETNDHQNPCQDPWMNFRGNSSLFQYVSLIPEKKTHIKEMGESSQRCLGDIEELVLTPM